MTSIDEHKAIASGYPGKAQSHLFPLSALTTLFFLWGFITCLNDILIPHLRNVFSLNYAQAMLIQFCFFGAYFLVSVPAGKLVRRIGYKHGVVAGLLVAGAGCALFYPAAGSRIYGVFLGALFVLASGITILQVAANPYVTVLGDPETAPSRLTLTQAFNSAGTTVAPFFGSALILGVAAAGIADTSTMSAAELESYARQQAAAVQHPYLLLTAAFLVLAAVFARLRLPEIDQTPKNRLAADTGALSIFRYRHLSLGALAIFLYVGAEVAIGSFLVNFLAEESVAGLAEADAARYIAWYWGGAMLGRFIGAIVMRRIRGGAALAFNAAAAAILVMITILGSGRFVMWSILAVGLFNAIMFPVIFSLAIRGLEHRTSEGSGILCLAIVGGAIVPLVQGLLADRFGIQLAFVLPLLCYVYVCYYGLRGSRPVVPPEHH